MGNVNAEMAEFADNLWINYIREKHHQESTDVVSYYRAAVVSNDGNNRLTIQRPFDNSYTVPCTDCMTSATTGDEVLVLRFGNGTNNANHIVVAKGDGNILDIPSHTHSAEDITSGTLPVARGGTGVTTLTALATALGVDDKLNITNGTESSDLNNCTERGFYSYSSGTANSPVSTAGGTMLVMRYSANHITQTVFVNATNPTLYTRKYSSSGWSTWYRVNTTAV